MTVTSTPHAPSSPTGDGGPLQAITEELRGRGWTARVVRRTVLGELDVRLRVSGPGAPAVELLDAWGSRPRGDRWHAVLISSHSRVVWCGPARPCAVEELASFVEDLLRLAPAELARRWTALG